MVSNNKQRIKDKIKTIKKANNIVEITRKGWQDKFSQYGIENYKEIGFNIYSATYNMSRWRIEVEEDIVYLKHESSIFARFQNDRGSYHLHDVFYDLDYCLMSIITHIDYA